MFFYFWKFENELLNGKDPILFEILMPTKNQLLSIIKKRKNNPYRNKLGIWTTFVLERNQLVMKVKRRKKKQRGQFDDTWNTVGSGERRADGEGRRCATYLTERVRECEVHVHIVFADLLRDTQPCFHSICLSIIFWYTLAFNQIHHRPTLQSYT